MLLLARGRRAPLHAPPSPRCGTRGPPAASGHGAPPAAESKNPQTPHNRTRSRGPAREGSRRLMAPLRKLQKRRDLGKGGRFSPTGVVGVGSRTHLSAGAGRAGACAEKVVPQPPGPLGKCFLAHWVWVGRCAEKRKPNTLHFVLGKAKAKVQAARTNVSVPNACWGENGGSEGPRKLILGFLASCGRAEQKHHAARRRVSSPIAAPCGRGRRSACAGVGTVLVQAWAGPGRLRPPRRGARLRRRRARRSRRRRTGTSLLGALPIDTLWQL